MGKRIYVRSGGAWVDVTTPSGGIGADIIDAKGDLIVGSADNTAIRLAVGTDGQILAANSAVAGGLEWLDNVAEETRLLVKNETGSTLSKGQVVYINGASGNLPTVALSQANAESTSSKTVGVVRQTITNNSSGYITLSGLLKNVDTQGFTAGQAVWLSAATAGAITATRPTTPNHAVLIGFIPKVDANGEIFVLIQNGFELDELHNVLLTSPASGEWLKYDGTKWVNATLPSASTSAAGIVQLSDSTSTTSSTLAATATAVKAAKDAADSAQTTANAAVPKSTVTAKGDLIVATASGTVTALPAGTNNYVLTADSAEAAGVKWAAAAGGGAEVFYQTSAPSTPSTGDIWVDSDDNTVTREAFYYQNDQPSTPMVGDIWVDANDDTTSAVIPTGSTSVVGIVQLTDSTSSTSTTTAATANSVKLAYDLANTANTTANAGSTSWVTISGAKAGTALGLASKAYAVTNLGNKTSITISGTTSTLMPKETRRISATSDIGSVGQAAATTWTLGRDSGVAGTSFLWGSSYGNGMYHATTYAISSTGTGIATSGAIRYSLDGSEWFQCELAGAPFTHNTAVQSVAYGNNMWIAGGELAQTAYSYDGITWTTFTPPNWASNTTRAAKYLNGIWFIGGDNARLATSTDGLSWTQRTAAINGTSMIYDIAYGNGTYVLVGSDGQLATSTNGTSWTLRTSGFGASIITRVEYGNGIFVACGYDGKLRTSTDGITWTTRSAGMSTNTIMALAFGNGLFVIGSGSGSTGAISTSTDGITWTSRTSNFGSYNITTGTYGNGMFLFAGENTRFVTASDGSSNLLFTAISYTSV